MPLRPALTRILGAVVAMLLVALSLGVSPAQASHGGDTHMVEATVLDDHGNGLQSGIDAYRYSEDQGEFDYYNGIYSGDGNFTAANENALELPPGDYKFLAWDYDNGGFQWVGGAEFADATVYPLDDDLDLGRIVFDTPATVSGRVTRASDGTPVRYADLTLENADNTYYAGSGRTGAYRFPRVAPGEYTLSVTDNDRQLTFAPVTVVVETADVVQNVAMIDRAKVSGTVRSTTGAPLRGIQVSAMDEFGDPVADAETGRKGGYTLTLEAGSYNLYFYDGNGEYADAVYADSEGERSVVVEDGDVVTDRNVTMEPYFDPFSVVDLSGRVVGTDGANGDGVFVLVHPADATNGDNPIAFTRVSPSGTYQFRDLQSGDYKLEFSDSPERDSSDPDYLPFVSVWSGGKQSAKHARTTSVLEDPAQPKQFDITMQRYGSISGTVKARSGAPALTDITAVSADVDENYEDYQEGDATGAFRLLVKPGQHAVRYFGASCDDDENCVNFVSEWWNNSPTYATARKVSVASAQRVTGIDAVLTPDLETVAAPMITGTPVVGNTLTATTGQWNLMAQNTYDYTWLRGSTPVGTGPTYKVVAADAGRPLSVRVDAQHGNLDGTALSAPVTAKRSSSTSLSGSSPKIKTVKLTVTVRVPGVSSPGGTVTFYRGAKAIRSNVALTKGVATVTVGSQPRGAQKYSVKYAGDSSTAGSNSSTIGVKIK